MLDENGVYQPFEDLVDVSVSNGNLVMSYNSYSVSFMPIFIMKNGEFKYWDDIPETIGKNLWKKKQRGSYKYGVDFSNISDTIKNNIDYIVLHKTGSTGLTWDDLVISDGDLIIKNKIKFNHDDILRTYTIPLINKSDIVIGNLTDNFVSNGDGTWNIIIDPVVEYNFNDTFQGDEMVIFQGADRNGFGDCTVGGSTNWAGGAGPLIVDIDNSEPLLTCIGILTDVSDNDNLDSNDGDTVEIIVEDPPDNGGGFILIANPSESKSTITNINFTVDGSTTDSNDLLIRTLIYNYTGDNWYQCADSINTTGTVYCDSGRSGWSFTVSDMIEDSTNNITLGIFGDWDSDPGLSAKIKLDYVKLEITYDNTVTTNLQVPINNYNASTNPINFTCNASSAGTLDSAILYLWDFASGIVSTTNFSTSPTGTSYTMNFYQTITTAGKYLWNCWFNNTEGSVDYAGANRTFIFDNITPDLSIITPTATNYNTRNIKLNYTVSDSLLSLDTCWYYNNSGSNKTITCGQNVTLEQSSDGNFDIYVYANDSLGNEATDSVSYTISTLGPSIVLNYPGNNYNISQGTDFRFNFTSTDANGLDLCRVYTDINGSWSINKTFSNPSSGVMQSYTLNTTTEGIYNWSVWCNDTTNNITQTANSTFNLDLTYPLLSINSFLISDGVQTFFFNHTSSDTYLKSCKYSIFNSVGNIDGLNQNVSFNCNIALQSATTTSLGNFNLTTYSIDYAGNENSTTRNFTIPVGSSPSSPPAGGGSSSTTVIVNDTVDWEMFGEGGSNIYEFQMAVLSERERDIYFKNKGTEEINLKISCGGEICDFITFSETELTLPVGLDIETPLKVYLVVPKEAEEKTYRGDIVATDENDQSQIVSIVSTIGGIGQIGELFAKLFELKYFLIFSLLVVVITTLSYFGLKPFNIKGSPVLAGFIGIVMSFGVLWFI